MNILLSYSYNHFDPDQTPAEQVNWNSSANILARTFYKILSEIGTVTYTDAYRYLEHQGKKFDLFVGIDSNFSEILASCEIEKSIYVAVNMHPAERNRILLNFIADNGLTKDSISPTDLANAERSMTSINAADFIFCIGNIATLNSYIQNGVPKNKIKTFNYGSPKSSSPNPELPEPPYRFLYSASEIGLRKGFDILYGLLSSSRAKHSNFKLDILGRPSEPYYEGRIAELQQILGDKMTYHGWIDASSEKYWEIIKQADYLLFPSLEEGQAGTIIDALTAGIVPILSANCGVDFSPLGTLSLNAFDLENIETFMTAVNLAPEKLVNLKHKTLEYYLECHHSFENNLKDSLGNCLEGNIYPLVSLILPVYNKEPSILNLLEHLDQAGRAYPAIELRVIFDGCTDKTEEVVRGFYQKGAPYPVDFETTPNIFEVKSNNLGLQKAAGKYCVIIQDDNYIYDQNCLHEAVNFLDKDYTAVILGGLAGVNFYPRGTKLEGPGQIAMNEHEAYWRQDANTDPDLKNKIFAVDACMRGPLIFRKSFLEKHGYLDEAYAPLYQDDMDIGLRAGSLGYKVYAILMDVENKSLTMAHYDSEKGKYFQKIMERNADTFYTRWIPSVTKDYLRINRTRILENSPAR